MASLQEIIDYSKANPQTDYAKTAYQHIQSGAFDTQATKEGIDLSWAGRPAPAPKEKTFKEFAGDAIKQGQDTRAAIEKDYSEGKIGTGEALFQSIGNVLGTAFSLPMALVKTVTQPRKGSIINDTTAPIIKSVADSAGAGIDALAEPLAKALASPEISTHENAAKVMDVAASYDKLAAKEADPEKKKKLIDLANKNRSVAHSMSNMANEQNWSLENAKRNVESTLNIGTTVLGADAAPALDEAGNIIKNVVTKAGEKVAPVVEKVANTGSSIVEKIAGNGEKSVDQSLNDAQKILNPTNTYTAAEKEMAYQKGKVTTEGKGPFKKEVITPEATKQTALIDELSSQGKVSHKNLPSKNIEALNQEARISDGNIDELVNKPELNKPYNTKTIQKNVFDKVLSSAKENLTFVADTTESKAYQEVLNVAKEEIGKQAKNSSGLRTAIKAFNARMERILGSDIYSGASESVGNARLQAAKDMRNALNGFLADNLEAPNGMIDKAIAGKKIVNSLPAKSTYEVGTKSGTSLYQSELQREAMLLNARDEIAFRSRGLIGKSQLAQFLKAHPAAAKTLKYVGGGLIGAEVLKELGM